MSCMDIKDPTEEDGTVKRIRLIIDTTDRIRRAANLRTYRLSAERAQKVRVSEFMNELLEETLAKELEDIDRKDANKPPRRR